MNTTTHEPPSDELIRSLGLVGTSTALAGAAKTIAASKLTFGSNVLIIGETGTGKTHLAKHLHESAGKRIPVFHVDCPRYATDIGLFKKELCGTTKRTPFPPLQIGGRFVLGKTDFRRIVVLHRITHLHLGLQVAIKTLMNDACYPNSSKNPLKIIATATLEIRECYPDRNKVSEGFTTSFLYAIRLPALRDRIEDIEPLIAHFAEEHLKETGRRRAFSSQLLELMKRYEWPGNARELHAAVHNLIEARCPDSELERVFLKERVNPEYFPGYDKRLLLPLRLVPPHTTA